MKKKQTSLTNNILNEFPIVQQQTNENYQDNLMSRLKYQSSPVILIRVTLFQKYSQSQNYYYTREINEILSDAITRGTVRYKDYLTYDDEDEYLKRYYQIGEYPQKIHLLSEYYKFHTDIPRIFMEPINTLLNKYYDKKRKFEYYRIARLIEDENKMNPDRPPKGIVGERPSPINSLEADEDDESKPAVLVNTMILKDISELNRTQQEQFQAYSQNKKIQHKQPVNQQQQGIKKKNDHSQTLQEICRILEKQNFESRVAQDESAMFHYQIQPQETLKLNNFIKYIKIKQENQIQQLQQQQLTFKQPQSTTQSAQLQQTKVTFVQQTSQTKRVLKSRVFSEQAELSVPYTPPYSVERLPTTRQNSHHTVTELTSAIKQQLIVPQQKKNVSSEFLKVQKQQMVKGAQAAQANVAAKQFQMNLLNLQNIKPTPLQPSIQSARASSAIEKEFKEALIMSNLKKLSQLKNSQQFTSHNVSPTQAGNNMQKKDLFQGSVKNLAIKKIFTQQQTQMTNQSKNQNSESDQSKQQLNFKVAKLQTIYIDEELEDNKFAQQVKQGSQTHRPKVNSQNFFTTIKNNQILDQVVQVKNHHYFKQTVNQQRENFLHVQQLIDKQKKQQPFDLKKFSPNNGNLEFLQTSQQAPHSNRSHKSTPFQSPIMFTQPQQSSRNALKTNLTTSRQNSGLGLQEKQGININQKNYLQELIKQADNLKKKIYLDSQFISQNNQFITPRDSQAPNESACLTERHEFNTSSNKKNEPKRVITLHNSPSMTFQANLQLKSPRTLYTMDGDRKMKSPFESLPQRRLLNKRQ